MAAPTPFTPPKKPLSYLYSLSGNQGHLSKKDDGYQLTMNLSKDKPITMFSDRPYRIVKVIDTQELNRIWHAGNNSFAANPPNAVLEIAGMESDVITIKDLKLVNHEAILRFDLTLPGSKLTEKRLNSHNLFVNITVD
jgi:hypothetical protein